MSRSSIDGAPLDAKQATPRSSPRANAEDDLALLKALALIAAPLGRLSGAQGEALILLVKHGGNVSAAASEKSPGNPERCRRHLGRCRQELLRLARETLRKMAGLVTPPNPDLDLLKRSMADARSGRPIQPDGFAALLAAFQRTVVGVGVRCLGDPALEPLARVLIENALKIERPTPGNP